MAPARDGIQVPVSILMKKGAALDGSSPLLLYAYGSYGITTEATFSSNVLSLVDRGMTFAMAHVRGGEEMGRQWYDDGKMMKKKNTFNDFIDVAEYLVKNGYTKNDRLAANGGSAGGLLMGAISNMRPDLFKVIVADVPFVDVINTMLDESLPLTAQEWEQWGNPKASAEAFEYMRSYSPYDNVEKKAVPDHARDDVAERLAGHVLGAGEVGREAARDEDRQEPALSEGQPGWRPRRELRTLRSAARDCLQIRFHARRRRPGQRAGGDVVAHGVEITLATRPHPRSVHRASGGHRVDRVRPIKLLESRDRVGHVRRLERCDFVRRQPHVHGRDRIVKMLRLRRADDGRRQVGF